MVANPSVKSKTCPQCRGQGIVVAQNSGIATVCPLCDGAGQQYDPGFDFRYEMGPIAAQGAAGVGPGASVKGFQTNVLDADFRARLITAVTVLPNGLPFAMPFLFQLYSGKNKRPFSNQLMHSQNWLGTNTNPFPLLTPFVFARLAPIVVDVTDLGGAAPVAWNAAANYTPGQVVTNGGTTYVCLVANTNQAPPNAAFWAVYSIQIRITLHGEEINA